MVVVDADDVVIVVVDGFVAIKKPDIKLDQNRVNDS